MAQAGAGENFKCMCDVPQQPLLDDQIMDEGSRDNL